VLDQSPIARGSDGAGALRGSLELARAAERLGFHRYWIAEHHETERLASATPEVLIGPIALATRRMRVGSGGVMLPHHSPRRVAESFSMLAGLFGDRIDLGVGRSAGTDDAATIHALQRDRRQPSPDDFPEQLDELLAYLDGRAPPDPRFAGLPRLPGHPGRPQPWLLGSTSESAARAARLGLPYAFGDFITRAGTEPAELYRRVFRPSERLAAPWLAICVSAICAETDDEARRLASIARPAGSPPPRVAPVAGSPQRVRAELEARARRYRADEVLVVTVTHAHEPRVRSYELIAQAFGP